jgi:hypothetical protein
LVCAADVQIRNRSPGLLSNHSPFCSGLIVCVSDFLYADAAFTWLSFMDTDFRAPVSKFGGTASTNACADLKPAALVPIAGFVVSVAEFWT